MAAGDSNGSLRFDAAINIDGSGDDISALSKTMDRLTKTADRLSTNVLNQFDGAEQAMTETTSSAESTSDAVKTAGGAVDKSTTQVRSLQKQIDAISIHDWQDNVSDVASSTPVTAPVATPAESLDYDPKAMMAVFGGEAAQVQSYADAAVRYDEQGAAALNQMGLEAQTLKQQMDRLKV